MANTCMKECSTSHLSGNANTPQETALPTCESGQSRSPWHRRHRTTHTHSFSWGRKPRQPLGRQAGGLLHSQRLTEGPAAGLWNFPTGAETSVHRNTFPARLSQLPWHRQHLEATKMSFRGEWRIKCGPSRK